MPRRWLVMVAWLAGWWLAVERSSGQPPARLDTESGNGLMTPAEALARMRMPPGFIATVFAAEPDVRNPIALAWDPRGRLWVAENHTYAELPQKFDLRLCDRLSIFEDADGDGRFDHRKIFSAELQMLTSVELGQGGVWLMCPPRLLFVADRDGDDVPDGPAEVVLDGFTTAQENHHTLANGLRWGPDGWLYGRCGASSPGQLGRPGSPPELRVPIRGGIWRYHPTRGTVEAVCHGTTNPWGLDWDAHGEGFLINTVNGHLWHLISGAHFARPHTIEPNPRVYLPIDQHADHYHWDTSQELRYSAAPSLEDDRRGGGHAHSGLLIYGADQWPADYRGRLLTLNFHGRRVNVERLKRRGSGFVGHHEPDLIFMGDPWFRGIDLSQGPDGGVFILDWSDTGECHEHNGVHRSSGRIFKITWGSPRAGPIEDLSRLDNPSLVALHRHPNEWFVRQSRRVLADRHASGDDLAGVADKLRRLLREAAEPMIQLRALWSLHVIGEATADLLRALLDHGDEALRAWAIRLLTDAMPLDTVDSRRVGLDVELSAELESTLERLARGDRSGLVRLVLASTLQRLPVGRRLTLARALCSRGEDASDHNLPSLIWTGLIPVAESNPELLAELAAECKIPVVTRQIARRLGEELASRPEGVNSLIGVAIRGSEEIRSEILTGLTDALAGWRSAPEPRRWKELRGLIEMTTATTRTRDRARALDVLFGDGRALDELRRLALDGNAELAARKSALATLVQSRPSDLESICARLIRTRFLNVVAVRGLAYSEDPAIGSLIADSYRSFHPSERPAALEVLASRPSFAQALLDRIAAGKIDRAELTPFYVRQIQSLGDPETNARLAEVWGELRTTHEDRRNQIEILRGRLDPATLNLADRRRGRALFDRVCGTCHRMYGHGSEIGPDLTGAQRHDLDYLLENLLDPSATVPADFRMTTVATRDGRVLNGLVREPTQQTIKLVTQTETLTLNRDEIEAIEPSRHSLMPDGLLDPLSPEEIRELIAYLMHPVQVPLPDDAD
jgi:putative membrane-bound dehydrogenase-like protein